METFIQPSGLANSMLRLQKNLNEALNRENFVKTPIAYVYNPTEYAKITNELYIKKYCQVRKKVLFVGINPSPFGMCQTGVPFGDTNWVKNWLHIEGTVEKPPVECPNRPVKGFECTRKEQSGDRWWQFWKELCGTAKKLFQNSFLYNYCPLAFMKSNGGNLTPEDIKDKRLEDICDRFFTEVIKLMQPEYVVAIGRYTEKRVNNAFKKDKITTVPVIYMPHPSRRAPNNQNWPEKALAVLQANNLIQLFRHQ